MNTISEKYIFNHITTNYGCMKQDLKSFAKAIRDTAKTYDLNKKDLFHYIIEREVTIRMATSYGFDTRYGRAIREDFSCAYYAHKRGLPYLILE